MSFKPNENNVNINELNKLHEEVSRLKSAINELTVLNDIAVASGKITDLDELLNLR